MEPEFTGVELVLGGAVFLAGLSLGLAFSRGGREARRRVRVLEAELVEVNESLAAYRGQVEKHFAQTSDLFVELTRQYAAVWDHLAEGARSLCPERVPSLGRGFTAGPERLKPAPAAEAPASAASSSSSPSGVGGDVERAPPG